MLETGCVKSDIMYHFGSYYCVSTSLNKNRGT